MIKQYYAFEWVVRPMKEIYLLINKQPDQNYELAMMNYAILDTHSIASDCFIIAVDSEEILSEFKVKIGSKLDVGNWRISSKEEFDRGLRIPEFFEGGGYGAFIDGTRDTGIANMVRMDQAAEEGKYFHYFACNWLITEAGLKEFAPTHDVAVKLGLLMYQLHHFKKYCYLQRLGIRTPSEDRLQQFVQDAGGKIGLRDWQRIDRAAFYEGIRFAYLYNVEWFIDISKEYAAANEKTGCYS
jgi:hypothetical protein